MHKIADIIIILLVQNTKKMTQKDYNLFSILLHGAHKIKISIPLNENNDVIINLTNH